MASVIKVEVKPGNQKVDQSNIKTGRRTPIDGSLTDILGGLQSKTHRMTRLLRPTIANHGCSDKKLSENPTQRHHETHERMQSKSAADLSQEESTKRKEPANQNDQSSPIFGTWGKVDDACFSALQSPGTAAIEGYTKDDLQFQFSSFSAKPLTQPPSAAGQTLNQASLIVARPSEQFSTPPKRLRQAPQPEPRNLATQLFPPTKSQAPTSKHSPLISSLACGQRTPPIQGIFDKDVENRILAGDRNSEVFGGGRKAVKSSKLVKHETVCGHLNSELKNASFSPERPSDKMVEEHLNLPIHWTSIPHMGTFGGPDGSTSKKIFVTKTSMASSEKHNLPSLDGKGTYYHPGSTESLQNQSIYERILLNIRFTKRQADKSVTSSGKKFSGCTHDLSASKQDLRGRGGGSNNSPKKGLCTKCRLTRLDKGSRGKLTSRKEGISEISEESKQALVREFAELESAAEFSHLRELRLGGIHLPLAEEVCGRVNERIGIAGVVSGTASGRFADTVATAEQVAEHRPPGDDTDDDETPALGTVASVPLPIEGEAELPRAARATEEFPEPFDVAEVGEWDSGDGDNGDDLDNRGA